VSRRRRNEIIDIIRRAKISVRSLPSVGEIIDGRVSVSDLRELDIDDLLGRDVVLPNQILLAKKISSRTVLVTGADNPIPLGIDPIWGLLHRHSSPTVSSSACRARPNTFYSGKVSNYAPSNTLSGFSSNQA
jgi:hypothetical protein